MYFTYIIKSEGNKWYYVGSTGNVEARLHQHNAGKVTSTKAKRPYTLVYQKSFATIAEARSYERRLKDRRREKEQIIREIEKKI